MIKEIFQFPAIIDKTLQFFSNNFELILYLNVSMILGFVVVYISLKLRERTGLIRQIRVGFDFSLYSLAALIEVGLLLFFIYVAWENYKRDDDRFTLDRLLLPSTHWIRKDLTLYYVEGNNLNSINIDGSRQTTVFTAAEPIKEYHFSPDGRYILVNTYKQLSLVDKRAGNSAEIDSLIQADPAKNIEGVISGIRWSPDSRHFIYEASQWSQFMTQDEVVIYDVANQKKRSMPLSSQKQSSLYWDKKGENLYHLKYESKDTSSRGYPYEITVVRIPLDTLKGEVMSQIPYKDTTVPVNSLLLRNIELFLKGDILSFGQAKGSSGSVNGKEPAIGIDQQGYLYVVYHGWFRKRLLKVPMLTPYGSWPKHIYQAEQLIENPRWLPEKNLIIMEHKQLGLLIMDPGSRKVGLLLEAHGNKFGWYQNVSK